MQQFELARRSLAAYAGLLFPDFQPVRHALLICEVLEKVERRDLKRLIIVKPPRHGGTLLASQLFPAWYLARNPKDSIIQASYGQELTLDSARAVKHFLTDPMHRRVFPNFEVSEDSQAAHHLMTAKGGHYYASSRGGPITGRGSDLLVLDDMLKDAEEARSETVTHALHQWYRFVARTRLSWRGRIVILGTRWSENDLIGFVLREAKDENWTVINLPAVAEADEIFFGRPFRRAGEALWPEAYPIAELEKIKQNVGAAVWASLFQGRPAPEGGQIFKTAWWRFYDQPPTVRRTIISLDCAFKTRAASDYSAAVIIGEIDGGLAVLHAWRARIEFPGLKRVLGSLAAEWKPSAVLIEDAGSGQSLVQELKTTNLPIIAVKVDRDKISRATAAAPMVEAGRVSLPRNAGWLADFLDELAMFPGAAHDDWTDAFTQAVNYLRSGYSPERVKEFFGAVAAAIGIANPAAGLDGKPGGPRTAPGLPPGVTAGFVGIPRCRACRNTILPGTTHACPSLAAEVEVARQATSQATLGGDLPEPKTTVESWLLLRR